MDIHITYRERYLTHLLFLRIVLHFKPQGHYLLMGQIHEYDQYNTSGNKINYEQIPQLNEPYSEFNNWNIFPKPPAESTPSGFFTSEYTHEVSEPILQLEMPKVKKFTVMMILDEEIIFKEFELFNN